MRTLNILKAVSTVAAASVVAVIATGGKASAISFSLGGSTLVNPGTYNSTLPSSITLTASASATPNPPLLGVTTTVVSTNPIRTTGGLGITTTTQTTGTILGVPVTAIIGDTSNQIDGTGAFETLTLTFNKAVKLTAVNFASVGSGGALFNDDFIFFRNGIQIGSSQDVPGGNPGDTGTGTFSPSVIGTSFGFRASQLNDDFYISSVVVEAVPVPEPITIAAMVMGSGFGVLLYRKYNKAAKFSNKLNS
ncbi:PEP-CTERM sorting domain-containing protein [Nostoc sp.]|uniref:PEP-CTERM sorting domain-containing protein n=1 Tax=Nostoc sp. TaxID=1180 RepID=UPI002FF6A481